MLELLLQWNFLAVTQKLFLEAGKSGRKEAKTLSLTSILATTFWDIIQISTLVRMDLGLDILLFV